MNVCLLITYFSTKNLITKREIHNFVLKLSLIEARAWSGRGSEKCVCLGCVQAASTVLQLNTRHKPLQVTFYGHLNIFRKIQCFIKHKTLQFKWLMSCPFAFKMKCTFIFLSYGAHNQLHRAVLIGLQCFTLWALWLDTLEQTVRPELSIN